MHLPAYCICRRFQQKFYIFLQFLRLSNTIEISLARIFIFKGYLRFHLVTDKKKKDERRECYGIKNGGQKKFPVISSGEIGKNKFLLHLT